VIDMNPSYAGHQAVRALHIGLANLGLPSPLGEAVAVLERSDRLDVQRMAGVGAARAMRAQLAQDIAAGPETSTRRR